MTADWCEDYGTLTICGTRMIEHSRDSIGDRWCFHCRRRHEFHRVFMVPDGPSWYDPHFSFKGVGPDCTDLFPGWVRTWEDE